MTSMTLFVLALTVFILAGDWANYKEGRAN